MGRAEESICSRLVIRFLFPKLPFSGPLKQSEGKPLTVRSIKVFYKITLQIDMAS